MGIKSCLSCGAVPLPEARFCRSCGAPLKAASAHESEAPVSPLAQTVPLSNEGRSTDGLVTNDARRTETGKVGQAEVESWLKSTRSKHSGDGQGNKDASEAMDSTAAQTATTTAPASHSASAGATREKERAASPQTVAPAAAATQQSPASTRSRRLWQAAAVVLLCVALVAGVMAFILSRRSNSSGTDNTSPISISDQKQLVSEKLAEADILLEAGEFSRAITVLRSAVKLDPMSAEAQMRLGNALERTGERAEAIGAYRAATQSSPDNVSAWRALAAAQVAEKLYSDAAESYRRLIETAGDSGVDDQTRLAYAENLRLSGRNDEARLAYQKITISADETIAREARARLVELSPPPGSATTGDPKRATPRQSEEQRAPETVASASPLPAPAAPTPAPTPARIDADSYYLMAMNIVNGRDPRNLNDGELAAALNYFLLAQKGTHAAASVRYADRLGKEYDRRKKKG